MKRSVSFSYDVDLAGNATGFAAISLACANAFEKLKSVFGNGSHGHSGIHATGSMHVEVVSSIEFSADEARLAADITQEQYDKLPENMDKLVEASRKFGEYLRDESKNFIRFYGEAEKLMDEELNDDEEEQPKKSRSKKA